MQKTKPIFPKEKYQLYPHSLGWPTFDMWLQFILPLTDATVIPVQNGGKKCTHLKGYMNLTLNAMFYI